MKKKNTIQIDKQKSTEVKPSNTEKRLRELGLHINPEWTFSLFGSQMGKDILFGNKKREDKNG